jgi:hypothetical protein
MKAQYHKGYNPVSHEGCYFIALGAIAEEISESTTTYEMVNEVYAEAVYSGFMQPNCYVLQPDEVCNLFLEALGSKQRVKYIGWWNFDKGPAFWTGSSEDIDYEILRVSTPWGYHFKTADFNPYPELKQGDEINGRRYFKVV